MIWFSSDLHLGHHNIIKYSNRPFKDVYHMHENFVRNFNERVKEDDTVIFVGDFCFKNSKNGKVGQGTPKTAKEWLKDYNGQWIFVKGNHDGNNSLNTPITKLYLKFGGERICVVHKPEEAEDRFRINLVGHVHHAWKIKRLYDNSFMYNVGVDANNYKPVNITEIIRGVNQFKKNEKIAKRNLDENIKERTQSQI